MNNEEMKLFINKHLQHPISYLTEENIDKLEQHCEKTINYATGRMLVEHQVTLNLIQRYKELKAELQKEKQKNKELLEERKSYAEEYIHNNPWLYKQLNELYVFKTTVKDKIEEIDSILLYVLNDELRQQIKEILEELLEEKE